MARAAWPLPDSFTATEAELPDLGRQIERRVNESPQAPALIVPGGETLDYATLWARSGAIAARLASAGVVSGDAVAVHLPEGPEALVAFLGVTRVAACAPLNPGLRPEELAVSLARLGARALLVPDRAEAEVLDVAARLEVAVFPHTARSGTGPARAASRRRTSYLPGTALLLFTSATTGRPKLVPLTHRGLVAMVASMRAVFPQADAGRVLIITPHFHLQCLLSALIQLFSGGAVVSTPGFHPTSFASWMREVRPTQYSANPTLHRAILEACPPAQDRELFGSLRFVTSAGAPLPEALRDELERRLAVPVVEGYGLTEAGRVTMTPFEPRARRPGSVGRCCGPEVAILGDDGTLRSAGCTGEIVLRGPTVIESYANDPAADAEAFRGGWFRTGDLGRLDADGFLYLEGRIKEAINRGAEKILPYEIEEVLSRHPAVAETVVFAVPHPRLGEDLAAAVVLRAPGGASARELRTFAAESLAEFKIPRRFVFVDEIPKGSTGKPQRTSMAERLGLLNGPAERETAEGEPADAAEAEIAGIWSELLGLSRVERSDDFFLLGGESLLALTMLGRVNERFSCNLLPGDLAASATLESLATAVRISGEQKGDGRSSCVFPLSTTGAGTPLVLVHALDGGILSYRLLARSLGGQRPVFGIQAPVWPSGTPADTTLQAMARHYVDELRGLVPAGPIWLGGHSMGGLLALEMARRMAPGGRVAGVVLLDTDCHPLQARAESAAVRGWIRVVHHASRLGELAWPDRPAYLAGLGVRMTRRSLATLLGSAGRPAAERPSAAFERAARRALGVYRLLPLDVRGLFLSCLDGKPERRLRLSESWPRLLTRGVEIHDVPGDHVSLLREPHVEVSASEIAAYLAREDARRKGETG